MSTKTKTYGAWLASMKWNYNATIRMHYKLTEFNINPMMNNLISHRSINKVFYSIEKDRNDNMTHVHILIDTDFNYTRHRLSKELGINNKSVSFIEEVNNVSKIGHYVTKDLWKKSSFHNILFNKDGH